VCGLTFRLGARRADGGVDRAGFLGGPADMIDRALRLQAPWLEAARRAPRERFEMQGRGWVERTTSLMRAAHQGNEHRVRLLLAAGAPLRCVDDSWRMTALHNASAQGSARAVAALLEADAAAGATVNAQDTYGRTALVLASVNGHEGAVRALLAGGARQGLLGNAGRTALHLAAANGHTGVVRLLCAAPGAPVDAQDSDGSSPLLLASRNGSEDAVRILLARGAQQGLRDSGGMAALHQAASYGYAGIVEMLCTAPGAAAALALRDGKGRTPLAAASGAACAAVLRAHGAS
jgi:ankyrin repeat protein